MKRGVFAVLAAVLLAVVCFASPPVEEKTEVSVPSPESALTKSQDVCDTKVTETEMSSEAQGARDSLDGRAMADTFDVAPLEHVAKVGGLVGVKREDRPLPVA